MKLTLPKLSATMEEGTIGQWMKQPGDTIREGDVLYEVETDKTTIDVESSVSGILETILVAANETIAVGTEVCMIRTEAEQVKPESFLRASPSARRLARELGVDIASLTGTGPLGRIRNMDVEAAVRAEEGKPAHASDAEAAVRAEKGNPAHARDAEAAVRAEKGNPAHASDAEAAVLAENEKPVHASEAAGQPAPHADVSAMRKTIAREMVRSVQTIPMFWVEKWVNAAQLLKWKELLKQSRDSAFGQLTVTDFVLQAIGLALEEMPFVNRRWVTNAANETAIEQIPGSHVGLAIRVEGGVVAPIITNAGALSLLELTCQRSEVVAAARYERLQLAGQAAAITLSNLGNTGIDRFRAIIKPDESMIVALGGLREIVAAEQGNIAIQQGFTMVLSADHRLIDGAEAAQFLALVATIIESGNWKIA